MSKSVYILVPLVVVLSGALAFYVWPEWQLKNQVRSALKDPDSAQFSKIMVSRKTGAGCGYVNAKNSMGGYVGDTLFAVGVNKEVRFAERGEMKFLSSDEKLKDLQNQVEFLKFAIEACPEYDLLK